MKKEIALAILEITYNLQLNSYNLLVEEHSVVGRSMTERTYGRSRRENAGISSESKVRIFAVENLRFPGEGSSAQGKSGPKVRPKRRSRWTAGIRFLHREYT